jgi:hypothetical protein
MTRLRWLSVIVGVILPITGAMAQGSQSRAEQLSPEHKSILLPGWGQLATGHTLRGISYLSCEAISAGLALYFGISGSQYYDKYRKTSDPREATRFRQKTISCDKRRNAAIIAGLAVWSINLLDIYTQSPGNPLLKPETTVRMKALGLSCDGSGVSIGVSLAL